MAEPSLRSTLRSVFSFRSESPCRSHDEETARIYPRSADYYKLHEECGQGATSHVWKATCLVYDEVVAVKLIQLDGDAAAMGDTLWLVMPYVDAGNLAVIMQTCAPMGLSEALVASITKPVLEGLQYLHAHGFVHRDVKASNILLDHDGHVYLADFSIAAAVPQHLIRDSLCDDEDKSAMPFAGSICWMAPEVVEGTGYTHVRIESNLADHQHHPHRCDEKADVWSFGIMVLELLQGSCPGLDLPTSRVLMRTLHEDVTDTLLPEGLLVSKALRDALQRCLVKDPAERTSAARLLEHRFWVKESQGPAYVKRTLLRGLPERCSMAEDMEEEDTSRPGTPVTAAPPMRASGCSGVQSLSSARSSSGSSWDFPEEYVAAHVCTMRRAWSTLPGEGGGPGTPPRPRSAGPFARVGSMLWEDRSRPGSAGPGRSERRGGEGEGDHHLPTADSSPHASWHDVLELFAQASEVEPAEEPAVAAVQEEAKIHVARSFAVDTSDNEGGTDEQEVVDPGVRQWKALLPFVRRQSGDELLWRRVPSATRRPTTSSSSSRDTELAIDSLLGGAVAWVFQ